MTPGARLRLSREALQAKAARRERTSRRPPWGWRVSPDGVHLESAPGELAITARAQSLRAVMSFRQVVQALAAEGHRNREGRPLGLAAVHRILTRPECPREESERIENVPP